MTSSILFWRNSFLLWYPVVALRKSDFDCSDCSFFFTLNFTKLWTIFNFRASSSFYLLDLVYVGELSNLTILSCLCVVVSNLSLKLRLFGTFRTSLSNTKSFKCRREFLSLLGTLGDTLLISWDCWISSIFGISKRGLVFYLSKMSMVAAFFLKWPLIVC